MKKSKKNLLYILFGFISIVIFNKLIFIISSIKNNLISSNSYYYEWKFGKIFYTVQGSGKPLLLIHSLYSGSSDFEYKKMIKRLSQDYTVYTIDLLGFGRSDKPKITYTAFLYVQLITDFINNVIKEKTNIISSSKSNSFIIMSCLQNPDLFNKLLFINPPKLSILNNNPRKKEKILKFILETPVIGTTIYNIANSKLVYRKYLKKLLCNESIDNKIINIYYESAHLQGANNKFLFASKRSRFMNISINKALAEINNSIYILANDAAEYDEIITDYVSINPSIECSYLNSNTMLPQISNPKDVLDICKIYFN